MTESLDILTYRRQGGRGGGCRRRVQEAGRRGLVRMKEKEINLTLLNVYDLTGGRRYKVRIQSSSSRWK